MVVITQLAIIDRAGQDNRIMNAQMSDRINTRE
jgi:hypothetical protein